MPLLFPSQDPDENIYLVVREHVLLLIFKVLLIVLLFSLVPLFYYLGPAFAPGLFSGKLAAITTLVAQLYTLLLLVGLFLIFVLYYLNLHIVTNMRVVDVDQVGLFFRAASELNIDKIEDVTSETTGILGNIFDYGTVFIQTAGAVERFELNNVPHPGAISKIILDLYEKKDSPHP